jgi:hypothetical protein
MKKLHVISSFLITGIAISVATSASAAGYSPLPVTANSYNADVVVEKSVPSLGTNTTATVDGGTNNNGNTWYEVGYSTNPPPGGPFLQSGLPAAGTILNAAFVTGVSNVSAAYMATHSFQLAPSYAANNAFMIDTSNILSTATFTVPAIYTNLAFLVTSGNGGGNVGILIHHADSSVETNFFGAGDWFGGTLNVAFTAMGRINATTGNFDTQGSITSPGNPRLYGRDVPVANTTSPITSVDFVYGSGAANVHNQVYALAGASAGTWNPIAVTGYNADCIVEAGGVRRGPTFKAPFDGTTRATTQSMDADNNTGNSWYERGFYKSGVYQLYTGIPAAGSTIVNDAGDHTFTLAADYTANNAMFLNPTNATTLGTNTNVVVTLSVPTALSGISFLNASGNGPRNINVFLNHVDGTTENKVFSSPDWFNVPAANVAWFANGRVAVDTSQLNNVPSPFTTTNNPGNNPKLGYSDVIVTDFASAITNIVLVDTNAGGRTAVFAISGTTGPIPPTFSTQPNSITTTQTANVTLTAIAIANDTITYSWQKGTNGVYVVLSDGGNISGSTTTTLLVNNVGDGDEADYRVRATDSAGSVTSAVATVTILSTLSPVPAAGDPIVAYQPNGGSSPAAESVDHAIDGATSKYLNFGQNGAAPFAGRVGFVVTPSLGRSRVTAIQLVTANDANERDPANYVLEGSDDGGSTWTLISSNNVTMPTTGGVAGDGRNPGGLSTADVATMVANTNTLVQRKFANTNGYTLYRWWVSNVRNNAAANSMQIGEVRLLGVQDTSGLPSITVPAEVKAFDGGAAGISATVSGNPTPTEQWQKFNGSTYVNLSNGGNISGAQSTTLSIFPGSFSDAGNYRLIANNTSGSRTSSVVVVTIVSSLNDVTQPTDPTAFQGDAGVGSPNAAAPNPSAGLAFDDALLEFISNGSGPNAGAGFTPFCSGCSGFPLVGLLIAPGAGPSVVQGVRIYTGQGGTQTDPADFTLEGSANGTNGPFTLITSSALSLPTDRNSALNPTYPLNSAMQEVLFNNSKSYTGYRITFQHVRDDGNANSLHVGDIELLGHIVPVLTISSGAGGSLTISSSTSGELFSKTNLAPGADVWHDEGPITGPVTITPGPGDTSKFYRVQAQ